MYMQVHCDAAQVIEFLCDYHWTIGTVEIATQYTIDPNPFTNNTLLSFPSSLNLQVIFNRIGKAIYHVTTSMASSPMHTSRKVTSANGALWQEN